MREKGKFIVVEGIDGSGKTTQAYLLTEALRIHGCKAIYTTEPTYGKIGDILRLHVSRLKPRFPIYEALLYTADRFEHLEIDVLPKLRREFTVVSDRYLYSTLAYQGATGVDLDWLWKINFFAPKPDITVYIDLPPDEGLKRKKGKKTVFEELEYQRKVRNLYLKLAKTESFLMFDGKKNVKKLHGEIFAEVVSRLELKANSAL